MTLSNLKSLHEIDQFERVVSIPTEAITEAVLEGVRQLKEDTELEPAIRQILADPNDTPHGPTEIADILTCRVVLRGQPVVAGFVLKGRSLQRIKSRDVTHQFLKLRQIPSLQLAVLVAVGSIQDDAQRDFLQVADDAGADFIIVDATDCARLLIAYDKICPDDGTPFRDHGRCDHGHQLEPGRYIKVPVSEIPYYDVHQLQDVSHFGAKRYSAVVMVDRHGSRCYFRHVIRQCLQEIREEEYHADEHMKRFWAGKKAHVVWLYLAGTLEDVRNYNWLASAQRVDPALDPTMRPFSPKGDDNQDGAAITWNTQHYVMQEYFRSNTGEKGPLLNELRNIVSASRKLAIRANQALDAVNNDTTTSDQCEQLLQNLTHSIDNVTARAGKLPFPPEDLKHLDPAVQRLSSHLGNIAVPYSISGQQHWDQAARLRLVCDALRHYWKTLAEVHVELQRIR